MRKENIGFQKEQIITYIGNKRLLINKIEQEVLEIKKILKKKSLVCADLFAGSGVVSRMLKQHSDKLFVNDLEEYSRIVNACYLTNVSDFPEKEYKKYYKKLQETLKNNPVEGLIYQNYAPQNTEQIKQGERVFYTAENAKIIDTVREFINYVPEPLQIFFMGPLLYEASVHVNTGGIFKGFYKDRNTGIGKFGGTQENALERILAKIEIKPPVLSNFEADVSVSQMDANALIRELPELDILYLDPPYNQHPYGSNYFMLNVIAANKIDAPISRVSGIPKNWKRSAYNQKKAAAQTLQELVDNANAKFLIISYNSEGFISKVEMEEMLRQYGSLKTISIPYNTYRASRNLKNRKTHIKEYLFVLQKNKKR